MATITEDYVSLETAKLLKEKGFNIPVRYEYHYKISIPQFHRKKHDFNGIEYENCQSEWYSAPTQQMAMKWLREVHNIKIMIRPYVDGTYSYEILNGFWYVNFDSYEYAAEAAIKYCLKNLVK